MKGTNMITDSNNRTAFQRFIHYTKITIIHLLVITAALGFIFYRAEQKVRNMERQTFEAEKVRLINRVQELESLKGQN